MNKKGFTNIALTVLIVVIVGVAGYFAFVKKSDQASAPTQPNNQPTPALQDEIASWETYRNEKYGFELKYPSELKLSEKPGSTWTNVIFEKHSFNLTFFAGMREVGGYIGYGTVWAKKISIDGKMVDETLIKCEGDDVTLQIAYTKFDGQTRFDGFDSNCFDKSLVDTLIPQMEAVAKTLRYSK